MAEFNRLRYAALLAAALPRVLETDEELDRATERLIALDALPDPSPEERAVANLLTLLIERYPRKTPARGSIERLLGE